MTSQVDRRWNLASRWLLAPRCLVCREVGEFDLDLCQPCSDALPWNHSACRQCGLPLALPEAHCGQCLRAPPPFAATQAALQYAFPVDRLLPRFKFHSDLAAGALLAELSATVFACSDRPLALVPVPLHLNRLRQRGYDQALELAKVWARRLNLPLRADCLFRQRATHAQTELGERARRRNLRGAFALRPGSPLPSHVALIDDVMTTGATVRECARVLKRAGVVRVDVWVIARVA